MKVRGRGITPAPPHICAPRHICITLSVYHKSSKAILYTDDEHT
jgi:hypothetical protein